MIRISQTITPPLSSPSPCKFCCEELVRFLVNFSAALKNFYMLATACTLGVLRYARLKTLGSTWKGVALLVAGDLRGPFFFGAYDVPEIYDDLLS